ncbi:ThiF family adenylyltransferase [Tistrella mobilis]|uniref:Thiamine biosynthesis protein ThiF n=1 Tax=Tistrella mobilis TaxID=171437 RepID=A0A162LAL6_9PROT|nr:ThiF family adenylyltransferase [Tistrella mobilis]KYO54148.1 thiamine biosynthesis protein ThiF [Tistrella mobilis]
MTVYSLTLRAEQADALQKHLLRDDGCERAAYLLCRVAEAGMDPWDRQAHTKFLVREVVPVPDADVIESTPTRVTWSTRSFVKALKEAERTGQVVAVVHNHPAGFPDFSPQDDANERDLIQGAINRNGPGTRLLSLIMTPDGRLTGQVWRHPSKTGHDPLAMIRVVGGRFDLHYPERGTAADMRAFHRQALAFGAALNQDLRKLRVGIVGCGGTGSAVAMLLARLGVGQVLLIDNDIIDQTNLNRLHGAHQADADAMRPKVDVVARAITELGLGVRVAPIDAWVGDPACRDALKCCDIIFGCTDDHDGRAFINRFAYYYLTPVIDIGLAIDVSDAPVPAINALDGRVTVLMPRHTCLMCREIIDPKIAADQALKRKNPGEYEKRKAEAYVFGEGNPSPAVVTFTTELACMGVNELIHRLQGFRGQDGHAPNRVRKFHLNEDRRPGRSPQSYCPVCGTDENWGMGDVEPFMGRVD